MQATSSGGTPIYRVRIWDSVLQKQVERNAVGLDAAKHLLKEFNEAKRRPGRLQAEHVRFIEVAERYLVAYRINAMARLGRNRHSPKSEPA